jgi:integrative and conjugative element protein (TIGR02256 family)
MLFQSQDQRFNISLNLTIVTQMKYYAVLAGQFETGGILIGSYNAELDTATITLVSGPPSDSKAGRTWFIRGTKGLKKLLHKAFENAGTYYLGEWHYHPFASPVPSGQDIRQMKQIAADVKYNCPEPIMIILGGNPYDQGALLNAFVFPRKGKVRQIENLALT